jgi:prepilin-type processing-associated H-X9-DG protein
MSNYLFADGHAKAFSQTRTAAPMNSWHIDETPLPPARGRSARQAEARFH